jgi:hypothetical protein
MGWKQLVGREVNSEGLHLVGEISDSQNAGWKEGRKEGRKVDGVY